MESMRVGCFERTGCRITMLVNDVHKSKIKPQGMPLGTFTVPTVAAANAKANAGEDEDVMTRCFANMDSWESKSDSHEWLAPAW